MLDRPRQSSTQGFSLAQILDRSFRIYRQNFLSCFILSVVIQIPLLIVTSLIALQQQQTLLNSGFAGSGASTMSLTDVQAALGPVLGSEVVLIVVGIITALIQGILIYGPIVYIASENHMGRTATLGEGIAAVTNRLRTLGGGLLLFYVILLVLGCALALALFLCGLGFGILLYIGLVLGTLLVPTLLLERTSIGTALGRSWSLGKSRVWILLASSIGLNLVIAVIDLALEAVAAQIYPNSTSVAAVILTTIVGSLGSMVLLPLLPIVVTELYYDTRTRFEGLDIALKAVTSPNPSPADVQSPAPGRLIANEDYLNIALFAIGTLVIVLVLYFAFASLLGPRLFGL